MKILTADFLRKTTQHFRESAARFKITIAFLLGLCIYLLVCIATEEKVGVPAFYLSTASLMSLMLHLWQEEVVSKWISRVTQIVCHALLLADAIGLYYTKDEDLGQSVYLAQLAIILAMALGVVFLPFFRQKDDTQSWNFARRLTTGATISLVAAGVMTVGLEVLYIGALELFGITVSSSKMQLYIPVLFALLLPSVLTLMQIPQGAAKHQDSVPMARVLLAIIRFLFLPLITLYMLVLYIYMLTIIIRWELPNGYLTYLVSTMMVGMIVVEFLFYPFLHNEDRRFERIVARWLPVAMTPLVILMSIGIGRRLLDYGITTNRLYVLTLNIWFYTVIIGLFVGRCRRIHWVSISFGAILLLTSAHPLNFHRITLLTLTSQVQKLYNKYHIPMLTNEQDLIASLDNVPAEDGKIIWDNLQYIQHNYNHKALHPMLAKDERLSYCNYEDIGKSVNAATVQQYAITKSPKCNIPTGATEVRSVEGTLSKNLTGEGDMTEPEVLFFVNDTLISYITEEGIKFNLSTSYLEALEALDKSDTIAPLPCQGPQKAWLHITNIHIYHYAKPGEDWGTMNAILIK